MMVLGVAFYETQTFITAFTRIRRLSLSSANQPSPCPITLPEISILILSSHSLQGLLRGLLSSDLHTNTRYANVLSPVRATCPVHLILLHFITRIIFGQQYRSLSSSSCSLLHSSVISSLLESNIGR
jgi:hypothetical protein